MKHHIPLIVCAALGILTLSGFFHTGESLGGANDLRPTRQMPESLSRAGGRSPAPARPLAPNELTIRPEKIKLGDTFQLKALDGRVFDLEVTMETGDAAIAYTGVAARVTGGGFGHAAIIQNGELTNITLSLPDQEIAYLWSMRDGVGTLEEMPLQDLMPCWQPLPTSEAPGDANALRTAGTNPGQPGQPTRPVIYGEEVEYFDHELEPIPPFDSRPGGDGRPRADAVIYLDFDGEVDLNQPNWYLTQFTVGHSGMTTEDMRLACETVAEDFRPWNISVTTSLTRFQNAPIGWRMRCIVTPTTHWYYATWPSINALGVANPCSFGQAGNTFNGRTFAPEPVCFVFREDNGDSGKFYGSLISHEVGHTMGLGHDGPRPGGGSGDFGYYGGHGIGWASPEPQHSRWKHQNHWGAIMGKGETACLSQWCNWNGSPYAELQNFEDDVAIIGGAQNHFGPAADDRSNTFQNAWLLSPSGNVFSGQGEIGVGGDVDFYQFNVPTASRVRISVKVPEPFYDSDPAVRRYKNLAISNLNIRAKFYNSQQGEIANISEPDNFRYGDAAISPLVPWMRPYESLNAYYDAELQPGTYYFKVSGDGFVGSVQDIYPSYGSMGRYEISGSIDPQPVLVNGPPGNGTVGIFYQYQIQAQNSVTDYNATGLPTGLVVNRTTGLISGVPTAAGTSNANIIATGPGGTAQLNVTFTMVGSSVVGDAVDATSLAWTTPPGLFGWFRQTSVTTDGQDAAQSADINDNQQAAMETTVTGPGLLTFYWKVSSEYRWDFLRFEIDGVERDRIHQEVTWEQKSYTLTSGPHTLRWVYKKDGTVSAGSDAGWVDQVVWNAGTAPQFIGPGNVEAYVGTPLAIQPQFTNNPTSYGYSALPQGLSMNIQTGLITGTPEQAMITTTNIGAYSPKGVGQGTIRWTILAPSGLPVFQGPYRMVAEFGRPFYARLRATNGGSNWQAHAYSYYSGNIPAGLTLNSVTGEITGTPTGFGDLVGLRCENSVGPALGSSEFNFIFAGQYTYSNYAFYHRLGNGPTFQDNLTVFQNNDNDRDGQSNFQEFLARTDPNDPSSAFRMFGTIGPGTAANTVRLTWESVPAVAYHAESSTNGVVWTPLTPVDSAGASIPSPISGAPASPLTGQDFTFPFAQPGHPRTLFRMRIHP